MATSKKVLPKKRGRPATGKQPLLAIRAPKELIDALDAYAREQELTRSEAVRQLIERGLKRKK